VAKPPRTQVRGVLFYFSPPNVFCHQPFLAGLPSSLGVVSISGSEVSDQAGADGALAGAPRVWLGVVSISSGTPKRSGT
jgi:hypothetical protein